MIQSFFLFSFVRTTHAINIKITTFFVYVLEFIILIAQLHDENKHYHFYILKIFIDSEH